VFFVDSDMELTPRVVEEAVKVFEENLDVGGVSIPERSVGQGMLAKIRDYERQFYT
jgi:hypothetical protein